MGKFENKAVWWHRLSILWWRRLMSMRLSQIHEKVGKAGVSPAIMVREAHPTFTRNLEL
jgi:hypothetical protein